MFALILQSVLALVVLALLCNLLSLVRSQNTVDRLLALDTMYINSIALLLVYGIYSATQLYFEAALLIAMLGFVSTVAVCKFMLRGDIIE